MNNRKLSHTTKENQQLLLKLIINSIQVEYNLIIFISSLTN